MKTTPRVKRLFSPFVIGYCLCVTLVVGFIVYIAFNKTTITVTLKQLPQEYNFNYSADQVNGLELTTDFNEEYIFNDYAATEEVGVARGEVTIINNYSDSQALVTTTRLLSEDGVLFHTDETITVPAGGRVTVPVYADQAGASGNIGPSKFEIVALWDGLKDNIYGESKTDMTGGVVKRVTMTEEITEQAKAAALISVKAKVLQSLQEQAAASLQNMSEKENDAYLRFLGTETDPAKAITINADQLLFNEIVQTITPTVGTTGDTVVVTTTGNSFTILYTLNNVLAQVQADIQKDVPTEAVTVSVNADHRLVGSAKLPESPASLDFIDPLSLTNKTPQQINEQLMAFEQVANVSVNLSPIWASHSPALEQQIHLLLSTNP